MNVGRHGAYLLRYQVADFLVYRAALPVGIALGLGGMLVSQAGRGLDFSTPLGQRWAAEFLGTFGTLVIHLAAFLGVTRLVSDDRANGYARFLFSKPVGVPRFYAQLWVAHGALLVALVTGIAVLAARAFAPAPVSVGGIAATMALTWVLVGGVGFALSAVTSYDAILLVVAFVGSEMLHALKDVPESPLWPWLQQVTRLTLPLHKLAYVRASLMAGDAVPWPHVAQVVAYGVGAFALGIVVVRRRALSA